MEKTKTEQVLEWWNSLSIRVKWDLFFKYNPTIADAPASIGLNLNDIEKSHIVEIWHKENERLDKLTIPELVIMQNYCKSKAGGSVLWKFRSIQIGQIIDEKFNYYFEI